MHSTRPPVPVSQKQKSVRRRGAGEKRRCDSGPTSPSPSPAKRGRATPTPHDPCTGHYYSGGAFDAAVSQQSSLVDALPDEILCAIMAHVHPTSALVRAGSAWRRFHQAAAFVRAQRGVSRRRAGPHADPVGCAHQLLNAVSLDDPNGMIDALDTGHVSFDDLLDPLYLWSAATPNVVARVVGAPSLASDEKLGRPILERAGQDPARTGYYTPLQAAILCGSVMCVRALVAMGARMSPCQVGPLVRFAVETLAWNDIYVSHVSGAIGKTDDASRAEAHPRVSPAHNGEPGSACVDPIQLLSPIMSSLPANYLAGTPGRGILSGVMAKAMGRIMHMPVNKHGRPRSGCPKGTGARSGFSPSSVVDLDAVAVADLVGAVNAIVDDARALAVFLVDCGCRPWCPVRLPFGRQVTQRRDGSAHGDLQEQRREIDRRTERSAAVELLGKFRAWRVKKHAYEESPGALLCTEATCFLIESLVVLYDRLHPPSS
nr:F-box domain protein [Pandoravirus belohorizontensis]